MRRRDGTLASRREWRRSIRELGNSLGPTPAAVAASLEALNVRGSPHKPTDCAIARYLRALIGTESSVTGISVSNYSIHVSCTDRRLPITIRLPKPVGEFVRAFDNGCYPELIDPVDRQPSRTAPHARDNEAQDG